LPESREEIDNRENATASSSPGPTAAQPGVLGVIDVDQFGEGFFASLVGAAAVSFNWASNSPRR